MMWCVHIYKAIRLVFMPFFLRKRISGAYLTAWLIFTFSLSIPSLASTNGNIRVADFRDDYQTGGSIGALASFPNGWSYLWNAPSDWSGTTSTNSLTGPIDSITDYKLLKWSGTRWTADADDVSEAQGIPACYLQITSTGGHPGRGYNQKENNTSNEFDRFCISAFQVSTSGYYIIHDSFFSTVDTSGNGNEVLVYTSNTSSNPICSYIFTAIYNASFNTKLGYLNAGDKIYVAVGPSVHDGSDGYSIDYTIYRERRGIEMSSSCITELAGTNVKVAVTMSSPDGTVTNASVTLYWKAAGEMSWSGSSSLGNVGTGTLNNVNISGLARDTTYYYAFYAENTLTNADAWSATNCFTTFDSREFTLRQRIIFNGYTGTEQLTNFPALVRLNEGQQRFFHREFISDAGLDLRFLNADLTSVLNHEIELWNTNGTSYVWVQIPVLTNNTAIWAYWRNTNMVSASVYTTNGSTWSANYAAVWHFKQNAGVEDLGDSSCRGMGGIPTNNPASVSGKIAYGVDFNGTDSGFFVDSSQVRTSDVNFAKASVTWWAMTDFAQADADDWWEMSVIGGEYVSEITNGYSCNLLDINSDISGAFEIRTNGLDLRGSWYFIATTMSKPDNMIKLYVNGVLQASNIWSAASWIEKFSVGFALQRTGRYIDASMDELRLSTVVRSADWINACYKNQVNAAFCTYDPVDPYGWRFGTVIAVK